VGVSAQHGRAALRDVAGTARAASAKIRRLNQFKDMSHVHITQISTANVSSMKRVNQTRTNVINCLRIHQDLRAFPRKRLAHNALVGGSSPPWATIAGMYITNSAPSRFRSELVRLRDRIQSRPHKSRLGRCRYTATARSGWLRTRLTVSSWHSSTVVVSGRYVRS